MREFYIFRLKDFFKGCGYDHHNNNIFCIGLIHAKTIPRCAQTFCARWLMVPQLLGVFCCSVNNFLLQNVS